MTKEEILTFPEWLELNAVMQPDRSWKRYVVGIGLTIETYTMEELYDNYYKQDND